jgi:hypothetical protein
MSDWLWQHWIAWILLPFGVYFIARIIFVAYFHAKRDFLRRFFRDGTDSNQGQDTEHQREGQ